MKRALGFFVKMVALILLLVDAILYKIALMASDLVGNEAPFIFLCAIFLSFFSGWLWKLGKKLMLVDTLALLKKDKRPPILYLRSFIHDKKVDKSPDDSFWSKIFRISIFPQNMITEEEQLQVALSLYGPFVAIGKPGEPLPQLGAARLYSTDDQWKNLVLKLMAQSQLIVLRVGNTEGFWWEVENALRISGANIVFLLPETSEDYAIFKERIDKLLPNPLPSSYEPRFQSERTFGGFLYFDEDRRGKIVLTRNSFNKVNYNIATGILNDLKHVLQRLKEPSFYQTAPLRRLLAGLLDFLFFFGVIFLGTELIEDGFVVVFLGFFFYILYFGVLEVSLSTPGKKILGIETRHSTRIPISFFQGISRAIIKFFQVAFLPLAFVSIVLILLKKKPIHDLVLNTNVFSKEQKIFNKGNNPLEDESELLVR